MARTNDEIESVLVHVGLDRLGDGLLKLPFVQGLRADFPNAKLTWFAGKDTSVYARALAPLVSGILDEVIEYGDVGNSAWELLRPRPLGDRRFDLVIDTQRIFWTSLSARRIQHNQFVSPAARFLLSDIKPASDYKRPKSMQRQLLDLLEIAGGNTHASPARLDLPILDRHRADAATLLPNGKTYIGFAPGSGGRPKCWPLERYLDVAKAEAKAGRTPVFLIGPQEEEWLPTIRASISGVQLPLQGTDGSSAFTYDPMLTIAVAERLTAAVSNDSGLAHMLALADTPLVALYGPTVYEKFPPMTEKITVLKSETYGGRDINSIPVDAVKQALMQQRQTRSG